MPVHLTGRVADMDAIRDIATAHGLLVVEDTAQSVGSRYAGQMSGSFGDIGCFSTHPLKNLNACGDGGVLTTNSDSVAESVRHMRNHGLIDRDTVSHFSTVSRMDTVQAAILNYRLGRLDGIITKRRENAATYRRYLDPAFVYAPPCRQIEYNSFHTFVVQIDGRDRLKEFLAARGIGTAIHYPVPIHLQPASRDLGYKAGDFPVTERQSGRILTLPINQQIGEEEIRYVADAVNEYFHSAA
jgi:dTDP-4-amino-4,6-dideoxygalactose transaminase